MTPAQAVQVVVEADQVDLVSGLLWDADVAAVAEHPRADGRVLLRADVPAGGLPAVRGALRLTDAEPELVTIDDDGLDAWRDHASVVAVGRRIVVRPPWLLVGEVPDDAVVVSIDPGRSWGHGAHPTTRLCLVEIERVLGRHRGASVLDVGCGSGVLSVAAARLGAASVVSCDIDPLALEVTRANAGRNAVGPHVETRLVAGAGAAEPLSGVAGTFDLVVANIGAAALVELAPHLLSRVAEGGTLVLSGLLDPPPPEVQAAYAAMDVVRTEQLDDWSALVLE